MDIDDPNDVIIAKVITPPTKTYSAPRRFGIGTVLAVATAFGILIWALQLFDTPPPVIITFAVFLAIVGGVQAIFNNTPRWASIIAGEICAVGLAAFTMLQGVPLAALICIVPFYATAGLVVGYCGGATVAGLFLVMDRCGGLLSRKAGAKEKSPFD